MAPLAASLYSLPAEIRLSIYTHFVILPHGPWKYYSGLLLSCKKIYQEGSFELAERLRHQLEADEQWDKKRWGALRITLPSEVAPLQHVHVSMPVSILFRPLPPHFASFPKEFQVHKELFTMYTLYIRTLTLSFYDDDSTTPAISPTRIRSIIASLGSEMKGDIVESMAMFYNGQNINLSVLKGTINIQHDIKLVVNWRGKWLLPSNSEVSTWSDGYRQLRYGWHMDLRTNATAPSSGNSTKNLPSNVVQGATEPSEIIFTRRPVYFA